MSLCQEESQVEEILRKHFPKATNEQIDFGAFCIVAENDAGQAVEILNKSIRSPAKDLASLQKIEGNLRRASVEFRKLGQLGCEELHEQAVKLDSPSANKGAQYSVGTFESGELLARHTAKLADQVSAAASAVLRRSTETSEEPAIAEGIRANRQGVKKANALYVAEQIARVYFVLSGKEPSRRVDVSDNSEYGPFFELVRDVFNILEIDASPSVWVREIVQRKNAAWVRDLKQWKNDSKNFCETPLD